MRLSICIQCNEQLLDGDDVYAYSFGRLKLQDPMIGYSMTQLDALEHVICPKDRKPSGD